MKNGGVTYVVKIVSVSSYQKSRKNALVNQSAKRKGGFQERATSASEIHPFA